MKTGFLDVNGAQIWYEEMGEGKAVTFVHAGIANARMWDTQMQPFAEKYRVIRFDMRGFGQSELPAGPGSLSDDIRGVLDALGVEKSALVGCSMGGSASLDFALKHPDRVAALVLVGTGMSGQPDEVDPDEELFRERMEAAEKSGDVDALNELEMQLWVDGPTRKPEQVAPGVREAVTEMNRINVQRMSEWEHFEPMPLDPPAAKRLGEVHAPTLLIVGSGDISGVQKTIDTLASNISGARKVVMEGLAHVPNMERPEEFNSTILEFLAPIW